MRHIRAAGILVTRGQPIDSFLLMRHHNRWDLPKGHLDEGETERQCALRELREETGIKEGDIELDDTFRFTIEYDVDSKRFGERCHKTVVFFLARLLRDVSIAPTEHPGYQWFAWQPPHRIQEQTVDPLLAAVERQLDGGEG
jgi:8-oxo-dGTP pyrophosphatase MutT (NUDIX family)